MNRETSIPLSPEETYLASKLFGKGLFSALQLNRDFEKIKKKQTAGDDVLRIPIPMDSFPKHANDVSEDPGVIGRAIRFNKHPIRLLLGGQAGFRDGKRSYFDMEKGNIQKEIAKAQQEYLSVLQQIKAGSDNTPLVDMFCEGVVRETAFPNEKQASEIDLSGMLSDPRLKDTMFGRTKAKMPGKLGFNGEPMVENDIDGLLNSSYKTAGILGGLAGIGKMAPKILAGAGQGVKNIMGMGGRANLLPPGSAIRPPSNISSLQQKGLEGFSRRQSAGIDLGQIAPRSSFAKPVPSAGLEDFQTRFPIGKLPPRASFRHSSEMPQLEKLFPEFYSEISKNPGAEVINLNKRLGRTPSGSYQLDKFRQMVAGMPKTGNDIFDYGQGPLEAAGAGNAKLMELLRNHPDRNYLLEQLQSIRKAPNAGAGIPDIRDRGMNVVTSKPNAGWDFGSVPKAVKNNGSANGLLKKFLGKHAETAETAHISDGSLRELGKDLFSMVKKPVQPALDFGATGLLSSAAGATYLTYLLRKKMKEAPESYTEEHLPTKVELTPMR